ncbi:Serine/threonine protein kinase [Tessaracoccus bendigoensis DSM 12906]|uniref:non-specific serine/threonine protein kinase n=1 Tax=Tessaracoccus bendigoensis DSM 12906 TaxID=1123357 RepID=A0A1M6JKV0_9ACTN|nr:BREX system serine/threonine kinase PglW [Tessaracoccus bendigoensis]SHJ47310.1 Serine/threonine protein kinase [Tessaracoccus bendigoensis DSM 12906]
MTNDSARWVEVSASQFPHEREGLDLVRTLLPDETPFRAWSNFEFRDTHGRWHEVDLLLLARDGFHLVELKYYSGTIRGDDLTWRRDGRRPEDSPLKLARRKAQYLASKLQQEFERWVSEAKIANPPRARDIIPWVNQAVFLHHPHTRVELPESARIDLYGPDRLENQTGLPGISELLSHPSGHRGPIGTNVEDILVMLLKRIGLVQRREREAGSWVLEGEAFDAGEGWQDWLATHKVSQQERRRIRFQPVPDGAPAAESRRIRELAQHEYRVMHRLYHDGILRPDDIVDSDLGIGLVYPYDEDQVPLDLWLAGQPDGISLARQLEILRQVGDALTYAHSNAVVHRGLGPRAILVSERGGRLRVQVADWQSVGALRRGDDPTASGVTRLVANGPGDTGSGDPETRLRAGFAAPEGLVDGTSDRIRIDVFGLGALAFYLLAGTPAATSTAELRERLRLQGGLDVSTERPEVSPKLREAILAATRPLVSARTADVATFLSQLDDAVAAPQEQVDPLDAAPGSLLAGRFRLERRLGSGSTATGLLVTDTDAQNRPQRVLKVALDDDAASRLAHEAEVLAKLKSPYLVELVAGPMDVDGRQALLLSNAGHDTLLTELRQRPRLSLDLLERWGTDLLNAVVALDKAGVDHRDIKPANLGVAERSNKAKHLVLFDFSLSAAAASSTTAGTPPYLDPFLTGSRDRFDSAAERYSAAVVLFEMATGHPPIYGDGLSDPAAIDDDATISPGEFDSAVAQVLVPFFTRALAREAKQRHDTAVEMLREWTACFTTSHTTIGEDADALAAAATVDTTLVGAGLSARALSALEPFRVVTVGDLLAVDAVRLSRLSGTAEPTRKEIKGRAGQWRKRLDVAGRGRTWQPVQPSRDLPDPHQVAEELLRVARAANNETRTTLALHVLGVTGTPDAFATQALLAASLPTPVTPGRVGQLMSDLQEAWAADSATLELVRDLHDAVAAQLHEVGGVATAGELSGFLLGLLAPDPLSDDAGETRLAEGLLRVLVDRDKAAARGAGGDETGWIIRRREGRPILIADDQTLPEVAEALGRAADALLAGANPGGGHDQVVPAPRVTAALTASLGRAAVPDELRAPARLVRLAAALSTRGGASATNDLHDLALPLSRALALALPAVSAGQHFDAAEIRARVRSRFPALAPLPERPGLDKVVDEAGIRLIFDPTLRAFRLPEVGGHTTGLETRPATVLADESAPVTVDGAAGARLTESLAKRSFLALGTPALRLEDAIDMLAARYDAEVLDLSATLIDAMRRTAEAGHLPWEAVLDADAAPPGSRAAAGLRAVVDRSLPPLEDAVAGGVSSHLAPGGPLLLTDPSLLARYDLLGVLAKWMDLATSRARAVWLVVPQLHASQGAVVDARPLPLSAPGQFVRLSSEWIGSRRAELEEGAIK